MQLQVDKLAKNTNSVRRGEAEEFLQLFPACLAACRQLLPTRSPLYLPISPSCVQGQFLYAELFGKCLVKTSTAALGAYKGIG